MAYEVVTQQLFNPLVQLNQQLESEVQRRTAELALSLEAQERVRSELAAARTIQLSLLPHSTPQLPNLRVAGCLAAGQGGRRRFLRLSLVCRWAAGRGGGRCQRQGRAGRAADGAGAQHLRDAGGCLPRPGRAAEACNGSLAPRMIQSKQNAAFLSVVLDSAAPRGARGQRRPDGAAALARWRG